MKNSLLLFLLGFQLMCLSQSINLNQIGYPSYQKNINVNRGLTLYKNDSSSFAYVTSSEYYNLGNFKDTLILDIKNSNNSSFNYDVKCRNCNEIKFSQEFKNDSTYYSFSFKEDKIRFLISYERSPHGMITSALNNKFIRDTTIGFIRLKNTFIHYSNIIIDEKSVNIAVVDKNFNGRLDATDLLSISNDNFFTTVESNKSKSFKDLNLISINNHLFKIKIVDAENFKLKLIRTKQKKIPELTFHSSILDAKINGRLVSEYLVNKPFIVIFYWGSRYDDYDKDFQNLLLLKDKAEIISIYDSKQLPNEILGYSVDKKIVVTAINPDLKGEFDLNGYPNFLLIDKTGIVLSNEYNLDKIIEIIK